MCPFKTILNLHETGNKTIILSGLNARVDVKEFWKTIAKLYLYNLEHKMEIKCTYLLLS